METLQYRNVSGTLTKVADEMAQATLDQAGELTAGTREAKRDAQQKKNISLSQYEDGNYVKLDPHGLPLTPQPSRWNDDPLVGLLLTCLISSVLQC